MRTFKITLCIALLMVGCANLMAQNPIAPTAGDGTSSNPYQIATLDNLFWIAQNNSSWDSHYIQTADINATSTNQWFEGVGWLPIGDKASPFTGSYNGQGYVVDGLYINNGSSSYQGLFAKMQNADIRNLGVINASIHVMGSSAGGLAGEAAGSTIFNCNTSGTVSGSSSSAECCVGGLVGSSTDGSTIDQCYSTATVYSASYAGGLVGNLNGSQIIRSYSTGSVSGSYFIGGLVGNSYDGIMIENCYSTALVEGYQGVGGLVGDSYSTMVSRCYSTGMVTGDNSFGGLIGYNDGSQPVIYCYWDIGTSGLSSSTGGRGKTTAEMKDPATFSSWDFSSTWSMVNTELNDGYPYLQWQEETAAQEFAGGSGTSQDPFQITSPEHLNNIRDYLGSAHSDKFFQLVADIDLNGWTWQPIGSDLTDSFQGTFDGNGHTISNLYIYDDQLNQVGLFGDVRDATIYNVGLIDVYVTGKDYIGALVGYVDINSSLSGCYSTGQVFGDMYAGGLVGAFYTSTISNSYSNCSVNANSNVGGLLGYGSNTGTNIISCYSVGNVTANTAGTQYQGGLCGYSYQLTINDSYWNTEISGQVNSAGGGTGLSTAEMTEESYFQGFDFVSVWAIGTDSYPYLQWQENPAPHNFPNLVATIPTVTTIQPESITSTSAKLIGEIVSDGGEAITNCGFEVSYDMGASWMTYTPNECNSIFELNLTELSPNNTYFVRAYATNSAGTAYGEQIEFTTNTDHTVTFNVDMNGVPGFDFSSHAVYLSGTFPEWAVPGDDGSFLLNNVGGGIFSITLTLPPGEIQYKYASSAFGTGWDGAEWHEQDNPNRIVMISGDTTLNDIWGRFPEEPREIPTIYRVGEPISLGSNDARWNQIDPNYLDRGEGSIIKQDSYWKMAWDHDYLYIRVVVDDNIYCDWGCTGGEVWEADQIALYFNVSNNLEPPMEHNPRHEDGSSYSSGYYQVASGFIQDNREYGPSDINSWSLGAVVQHYYRIETNTRTTIEYEFRVAFNDLKASSESFSPADGNEFGFEVEYVDWDGWDAYQGAAKWWSSFSNGWEQINTIGIVRLSETEVAQPTIPVVTTAPVTDITINYATSGGNVTADGGEDVIARGVVWSKYNEPTVDSNDGMTFDGDGTGSFTSKLENLETGTSYNLRAYATNSVGTAYGELQSFGTLCQSDITISGEHVACTNSEVLYTLSRAVNNPEWTVVGGDILESSDIDILVKWTGSDGLIQLLEQDDLACPEMLEVAIEVISNPAPAVPHIHNKGADRGVNILICTTPSMNGYQWYRDGQPISGATEQFYVAYSQLGEYRVLIEDSNGCPTMSNTVTVSNSKSAPALMVYPNPTDGQFTAELVADYTGNATITVTTLQGQVIHKETIEKDNALLSHSVNIPKLAPGVYIVAIQVVGQKPVNTRLTVY